MVMLPKPRLMRMALRGASVGNTLAEIALMRSGLVGFAAAGVPGGFVMLGAPSRISAIALVALLWLGCAPSPRPAAQPQESQPAAPASPSQAPEINRMLVMAIGRAPESLSSRPLRELRGPGSPNTALRMLNAGLALNDAQELPQPYLAEALPQFGTESWKVTPDGGMETTYRLKSGLTWHDGGPLTARDFVFSWQVYSTPELGVSATPPFNLISLAEAPDPATLRIVWRSAYATADDLTANDFPPLPERLLGTAFARANWEAFAGLPYWTGEFVGAGPYRLVGWEPGTSLEGEAFPGHALGRAKINRIQVLAITDPNTAVANMLAGTVHIAVDQAMKDQQATSVEEQWRPTNAGKVVRSPVTIRTAHFQTRPEYANPAAVSDVRIRQAIAHATDRQAIGDAVTSSGGRIADILLLPQSDYYADAGRVTPKFPLDLQRSAQLMADAGYRKDADGFFASPTGRFAIEVAVTDSNTTEGTVFADVLRRASFETSLRVIPRAQQSEPLIFANFSGLFDGAVNSAYVPNVDHFRASSIARPETRYIGTNYAGFDDPEFERLAAAWDSSLERGQRRQLAVQLTQRLGEALPAYGLYLAFYTMTQVANLRGPMETVSSTNGGWNIHEWEWTS